MKKILIAIGMIVVAIILILGIRGVIQQKNEDTLTNETNTTIKESGTLTTGEQIKLFSKEEIESLSNKELSLDAIDSIYELMTEDSFWKGAGYDQQEASAIASRFKSSSDQAKGILTDILSTDQVALKVLIMTKPNYSNVTIGSESISNDEYIASSISSAEYSGDTAALSAIEQIEITIKYDHKKVSINYKVEDNEVIKAKYRNDFTGEELEGSLAQIKIEALFSDLALQSSTETEIREFILTKLELEKDYERFKFEASFSDQSETKFEIS